MEPVQLMKQLLTQLTTKPSMEIHPTPFTWTAADNILNWLENFNRIAARNASNDQQQLQVIPVYLKDTALNFYHSLTDQTKTDINLLRLLYEIATTRKTNYTTCVLNCMSYDRGPH